jgi:DNA-binding response OmpR family regulator
MAKVLVLEDEFWIADTVIDWLCSAGHEIIGPLVKNTDAIKAILDVTPDIAVLDVNIGPGVSSAPTAEQLTALGVPYIVLSGYNREHVPGFNRPSAWLTKPILKRELLEAVVKCLASVPINPPLASTVTVLVFEPSQNST